MAHRMELTAASQAVATAACPLTFRSLTNHLAMWPKGLFPEGRRRSHPSGIGSTGFRSRSVQPVTRSNLSPSRNLRFVRRAAPGFGSIILRTADSARYRAGHAFHPFSIGSRSPCSAHADIGWDLTGEVAESSSASVVEVKPETAARVSRCYCFGGASECPATPAGLDHPLGRGGSPIGWRGRGRLGG